MKNLKNLGEILNKEEQQSINGGGIVHCYGSDGNIIWSAASNSPRGDLSAMNLCISNGGSTVSLK